MGRGESKGTSIDLPDWLEGCPPGKFLEDPSSVGL